jgi:hypothetical protein
MEAIFLVLKPSLHKYSMGIIACANIVDPDQPTYPSGLIGIYTVRFLVRNNLKTQNANRADPDQMAWNVLADLDLHCCPWDNSHIQWSKVLNQFFEVFNSFLHIYAFLRVCDQYRSRSAGTSMPSDLDLHWSHFGQK